MKKLKMLSIALCSAIFMGVSTPSVESASIESKVEAEEFTLYSYCPETGEEDFIECDTSFVVDQINKGATHVTTPSYIGEAMAEQGNLGGEEISPNIIIGNDDTRNQITDTTIPPYRSICLVEVRWADGSTSRGTGCLIGPDVVLTSAHVVYNAAYGKPEFINVYPGLNGSNLVFGQLITKRVYVTDQWMKTRPMSDDWALLKLQDLNGNPTTVGNVTGYLGLDCIPTGNLDDDTVFVTGYPGDKAEGLSYTLWKSVGKITTTTDTMLYYNCYATEGESGAPVTNSSNKIVGIHKGDWTDPSTNNKEFVGVRVTSVLISAINVLHQFGW